MKTSIITAVFNGADTIEDCIKSILNQTYPDIEHIIIDGGSTDGTLEIIKKYEDRIAYWVSEHDNGIYDAMNKGVRAATGGIIGILNSDDMYADEFVIDNVVKTMIINNVESCYGDLVYVDRLDANKVVRHWKSGDFIKKRFKFGWMPPHPAFFVKRKIYEKYGMFNLDFPLAADYELMLRFLYKYGVSAVYIPKVLVKMRNGGTSQPWSYTAKAIIENHRAWKINGLYTNMLTFIFKPLSKIFQYIRRH